jgi:hypothetical protein
MTVSTPAADTADTAPSEIVNFDLDAEPASITRQKAHNRPLPFNSRSTSGTFWKPPKAT